MTLQNRILALVLALLLVSLGTTLVTVSQATYRHTLETAREELAYAGRIFLDKLGARERALHEAASTLAKDDALRQAIFADGGDEESMLVALDNHRLRTSADLSYLVGLDGTVLADTAEPGRQGHPFPFTDLLRVSEGDYEPHGQAGLHVVLHQDKAYQLVPVPYYVPVSAPRPSLWLLLGKEIDDSLTHELRELTGIDVSIVAGGAGGSTVLASSLPVPLRRLLAAPPRPGGAPARAEIVQLGADDHLALAVPLPGIGGAQLSGVLTRPAAEALFDFRKLSGRFLWIALGAALFALPIAFLVARSVTRPIRSLEHAARRIAAGDYAAPLPVTGSGGEVGSLALEFQSMQGAVRERETAIQQLAFHDALTGLSNRNGFHGEVGRAIERARSGRQRLAVLLIDLDRFREINDTLGHHVGDRVLIEIGGRLRAMRPGRDGHELSVARLGGDEFAVVLPIESLAEAKSAVAAMQGALRTPLAVEDLQVDVEASIGVAVYPDHGGDPAALLRLAEVAMYVAKERRLGAVFYDSSQNRHSLQRLSLAGDLRRAVEAGALELAFQPKLLLASGRASDFEVLLRWNHPQLGLLGPGEFIPIAEQTGVIREITSFVLRQALAQIAEWDRQGLAVELAVNLSALDLHDQTFARRLRQMLDTSGVAAERLVLEITESSVMSEPETARRLLDEVTAMGVTISIDDFGTGYSSLTQLKRLPVQELKVDKSFVTEMTRSSGERQIVRTIIELGHNLGLRVVAEGVESAATLTALREMGCDLAQGFHIAEPMSAAALPGWLAGRAGLRQAAL